MSRRPPRRRRGEWGPHARLEMILSALVLIALVVTAVVFIFVLHDFPFRTS